MESTTTHVYTGQNKEDSFFRKRYTATASFALGVLLFFLPFAALKCGSMTLMDNSGIGIAMGAPWKVAMNADQLMKKLDSEDKKKESKNPLKAGPNIFMLVAIGAAFLGMGLVLFNQKWRPVAGICAGILCCIMLIAVMIQFKMLLKSSMAESETKAGMDDQMNGLIKVQFTIWYYLSFATFAAAAFFNYKHYKIEQQDAKTKAIEFEFQHETPGSSS